MTHRMKFWWFSGVLAGTLALGWYARNAPEAVSASQLAAGNTIASVGPLSPTPASRAPASAAARGWDDGCSAARTNPFQPGMASGCDLKPADLELEMAHAAEQEAVLETLTTIRAGVLRGEPESAAHLLSHSHGCGPSSVVRVASTSVACEMSMELHDRAVEVLETAAERGDADAQFHLANWVMTEHAEEIEATLLADSSAALHPKLALAEDLFAQALAGGSKLAIEFMRMRNEPNLQADSVRAVR